MIKCSECGYENIDGLDYCDGCGAKLNASAGAPDSICPSRVKERSLRIDGIPQLAFANPADRIAARGLGCRAPPGAREEGPPHRLAGAHPAVPGLAAAQPFRCYAAAAIGVSRRESMRARRAA